MTGQTFRIGDTDVPLYGDPAAKIRIVQPVSTHDAALLPDELDALRVLRPGQERCVAAFPVRDWDAELSPWEAAPVFGHVPFGVGAGQTLSRIEKELLPAWDAAFPARDAVWLLCGYSLAGLFALWTARRTDRFAGAAGVSPSVWFPGWADYAAAHPVQSGAVYLSLGDREEKAKDPRLAAVGDAIRREYALLTQCGTPCTLEWNAGNHFADVPQRLARGIAWLEARLTAENAP